MESHKSIRLAAGTAGHGILAKVGDVINTIPLEGGTSDVGHKPGCIAWRAAHRFPSFLPDGRHFVYLARSPQPEYDRTAYMMETGSHTPVALFDSDSQVVYAAPGYLLYMVGNTLLARPFDAASLRVTGEPIPIAEQVERKPEVAAAHYGFSDWSPGLPSAERIAIGLVPSRWPEAEHHWPSGHHQNPALSPDGTRVAVSQLDLKTGTWDIWLIEVATGRNRGSR